MADATLDHLDHDALFLCHIEPSIFADHLSPNRGPTPTTSSFLNLGRSTPPSQLANIRRSSSAASQDLLRPQSNCHQTQGSHPIPRISHLSAFLQEMENDDGQEALLNNQLNEQRTLNGRLLGNISNADRMSTDRLSSKGQAHRAGMVKGQCLHPDALSEPDKMKMNKPSPSCFCCSCQHRSPPNASGTLPSHLLPPTVLHLLLLRPRGKPPLSLPQSQRRFSHQAVSQHERPVRGGGQTPEEEPAEEQAPQ